MLETAQTRKPIVCGPKEARIYCSMNEKFFTKARENGWVKPLRFGTAYKYRYDDLDTMISVVAARRIDPINTTLDEAGMAWVGNQLLPISMEGRAS